MNIEQTYLKNNGLYQNKFRKLITLGNHHLVAALELYNLFHGSSVTNKMTIEADPIFRHYIRMIEHLGVRKYLKCHTISSYESLIDFIVDWEYAKI